ncbi:MAG: NAD(+) synthase [Prevotella sp.]|nr:NAD(+) synthase [Prevotella sp.]
MNYGYIKVASAIPSVKVGDCHYNLQEIEQTIIRAEGQHVEVIVFPELSITGYTCQDLFRQQLLLDASEQAIVMLLDFTRQLDIISIVGVPVQVGSILLNCAAVIQKGELMAIIPKTYLPNYNEFYEKRWFASSQDLHATEIIYAGSRVTVSPQPTIFHTYTGATFGVELCEDVWAPEPPSTKLTLAGADIVFNLSASDELIGKHTYLCQLLSQQSARTMSGYVYSSSGFGESTQDVVYGGNALIYENGQCIAESERFSFQPQMVVSQIDYEKLRAERRNNTTFVNAQRTGYKEEEIRHINCHSIALDSDFRLMREVSPTPFIPHSDDMKSSCEEIFNIQVAGLAKRLTHTGCDKVVIGISGGLDSTLALLVCIRTFDKLNLSRKGILGVTMPGFGTTDRTYTNAINLMKSLGVTIREISIRKACVQHFEDIGHDIAIHDVTYENGQARERTQILMDLSNQIGGLVIGTGDLSELALGWATYNGDHMSMYGVNVSIPKTLIRYLVQYVAESPSKVGVMSGELDEMARTTLLDVINTPISPELIPADSEGNISQKTEDLVGPYVLHDFFLYYFLRCGFKPAKIFMLAKQAFTAPNAEYHFEEETIEKWLQTFLRRFFSQQFKRSCLPDGPKVGSVSLSPRGDWRMASDASSALWLKACSVN